MAKYVTLHTVVISAPGEQLEVRGYGRDGAPTLRKRIVRIQPRTVVELDAAVATDLVAKDAIRPATAWENQNGRPEAESRETINER